MINAKTVKQNINRQKESLYHTTLSGNVQPFVCLVCEKLLAPKDVELVNLQKLKEAKDVLTPSL